MPENPPPSTGRGAASTGQGADGDPPARRPASRWHPVRGSDGPVPLTLAVLTVVAGLVDAVSFLLLGQVFVANMTGNVVFVGFGLAGTGGISAGSAALAFGAFCAGAVAGGWLARPLAHHRGRLLFSGALAMAVLAAVALAVLWDVRADAVPEGRRVAAIIVLAVGMGLQSAVAARVGVPDMRTTVVTSALAALASGVWSARDRTAHAALRTVSVATMLLGALCGALLLRYMDPWAPLVAVIALLAVAMVALAFCSRQDAPWHRAAGG